MEMHMDQTLVNCNIEITETEKTIRLTLKEGSKPFWMSVGLKPERLPLEAQRRAALQRALREFEDWILHEDRKTVMHHPV